MSAQNAHRHQRLPTHLFILPPICKFSLAHPIVGTNNCQSCVNFTVFTLSDRRTWIRVQYSCREFYQRSGHHFTTYHHSDTEDLNMMDGHFDCKKNLYQCWKYHYCGSEVKSSMTIRFNFLLQHLHNIM